MESVLLNSYELPRREFANVSRTLLPRKGCTFSCNWRWLSLREHIRDEVYRLYFSNRNHTHYCIIMVRKQCGLPTEKVEWRQAPYPLTVPVSREVLPYFRKVL